MWGYVSGPSRKCFGRTETMTPPGKHAYLYYFQCFARNESLGFASGAEVGVIKMNFDSTAVSDNFKPEAEQQLMERLFVGDLLRQDVVQQVQELERVDGLVVYADLMHLLSHLRFEPEQAKEHWLGILTQQQMMEQRLDSPVELRLALLRYFTQIHPTLVNPKIIEARAFEQTQTSVYTDELTGVRNYRFFLESLRQEVLRSNQYGAPFSLIMMDVDFFKRYNDYNGHESGNAALAQVGNILTENVRAVDAVSRYGGEEFAIITPATEKCGAEQTAQRIRSAVACSEFPSSNGSTGTRLTASFGVATYPGDAANEKDLVQNADHALYLAKGAGRNRVCMFGDNSRSYPRRVADFQGTTLLGELGKVPIRVLQVGEGGMLIHSMHEIAEGRVLDVSICMPGSGHELQTSGRVLRVSAERSGGCKAAVRFLELAPTDRWMIRNFVSGD